MTPEPGEAPLHPVLRHARAAFVAFHVLAVLTVAVPSVGSGLNRSAWRTATVQDEFRTWTTRLNGWGVKVTPQRLEDVLWDFAVAYEGGRRKVLTPMLPYLRYTGTAQSWRMFVAPHRYPGRLLVEVDQGEGWEPIYRARSPDLTWRRGWFDHDRTRAAVFRYAWRHYRRHRRAFAEWVTRKAALDYPDATRVRVSFERYRTLSPEQVRAGETPNVKRELAVVHPVSTVAP